MSAVLAALFLFAVAGCGTAGYRGEFGSDRGKYVEEGLASWYGKTFHGRRTASGRKFNMRRMSAAHKTLPFHTVVRVTNLRNGRKVKVRITDRGPFVEGRIIDLSRKAARALDMERDGVVPVRITVVKWGNGRYHR